MISRAEVAERPLLRIPVLVATIWLSVVLGVLISGTAWDIYHASQTMYEATPFQDLGLWAWFGSRIGWGPGVVGAALIELARRWAA